MHNIYLKYLRFENEKKRGEERRREERRGGQERREEVSTIRNETECGHWEDMYMSVT